MHIVKIWPYISGANKDFTGYVPKKRNTLHIVKLKLKNIKYVRFE